MAALRDALLDVVDLLIGGNHGGAYWGGSGSRPRNCLRSAVNGSSFASLMVNQASAPAPIRFSTAAMASAIGHEAPWPHANTIAAATSAIHEVTTSTAATSTDPRIHARRMAARRASRTVSSEWGPPGGRASWSGRPTPPPRLGAGRRAAGWVTAT